MSLDVEFFPDGTPVLLCTGCALMVALVVTFQDRRGGASLCESCVAKAWEALEAHQQPDDFTGGEITEMC